MRIVKGITLAALSLILPVLVGCRAVAEKPPVQQPALSRPTGVETPQDTALSKAVKERLLAEKAANLARVVVESSKGSVYLSGVVPSLDARERAVKIAWQVPGVAAVVNHLQVGD